MSGLRGKKVGLSKAQRITLSFVSITIFLILVGVNRLLAPMGLNVGPISLPRPKKKKKLKSKNM
jgi:hypothetical protein